MAEQRILEKLWKQRDSKPKVPNSTTALADQHTGPLPITHPDRITDISLKTHHPPLDKKHDPDAVIKLWSSQQDTLVPVPTLGKKPDPYATTPATFSPKKK